MATIRTGNARSLGTLSAAGTALLGLAYALTLIAGFLSLAAPDQPIGDPYFAVLEGLIVLMAPVMVVLFAAIHASAPARAKPYSLIALVFISLMAGITCCVHFLILTLSRQPEFTGHPGMALVFAFEWPSVAYALDILAWDVFFALAALFAAPVFGATRLGRAIRLLLAVSGLLSLAGLAGVVSGDMQLRNIGILGYAGVFPVAAGLLAVQFGKGTPAAS